MVNYLTVIYYAQTHQ